MHISNMILHIITGFKNLEAKRTFSRIIWSMLLFHVLWDICFKHFLVANRTRIFWPCSTGIRSPHHNHAGLKPKIIIKLSFILLLLIVIPIVLHHVGLHVHVLLFHYWLYGVVFQAMCVVSWLRFNN